MFTPPISSDALFHRKGLLPVINPDQPGTGLPHPAPRAPRIFADSATRADIEPLFRAGIINGITTNPSLLKKAGATSWEQAKTIMRDLCTLLRPHPVSLELTETREEEMVKQASELSDLGDNSIIKVPIGGYRALDPKADPFTGLKVIRRLWQRGIKVNTTLVFNTTQALWAANAGAVYVSPFLGRLADYALKHDRPERSAGNSLYWVEDPQNGKPDKDEPVTHNTEYVAAGGPLKDAGARLIFEIAAVFANYRITTEILAASIRNPVQLTECLLAGADILTVPAPVLSTVADHPLSDAGMKAFAQDATAFGK
ncbi:MAG TPA: transaldolase family protein [Polyangia bacterium]|nr:transaldolase family protein [Polyangia bacterium]